MLKIGDFSKLSRISIRMLRHYDEIGLLKPVETDPFTGYRYYREDQLHAAARISAWKSMGFSVVDMCRLQDADPAQMEAICRRRRETLLAELREVQERLRFLDTAEERLRKDDPMKYDVALKTIPECYAACVRMILPSYDDEGMGWGILMEETAQMDLIPDDPCLCCVTFYDDEYKEKDVDVEIRKTVKGTYPDTEHVKFRTLPAVEVASCIHNGSYAGLDDAMRTVAEWIAANGYEVSDPPFNIYHVSPYETDDPEKFVTEVCYPVKKR